MKLNGDFINLIPWLPLKTVWSENCRLATWPNDEVIYFSSIINGTNSTNVRKKEGLKNTFDRECSLWDFSSGRRTTIFLSYFRSFLLLYISSLTNDDFVLYRGPYLFPTNKGSRKKLFLNTAHCFILLSKMKRKCYYKEIKLIEPWFIENYL